MRNKRLVLLKSLLLETSAFNILKHEKDAKKRNKILLSLFCELFIGVILIVYMTETSKGYVSAGITSSIPSLCAIIISLVSLFLTFIKTNGYLFAFKDYDITMSLPIRINDIVAARFIYMYLAGLLFYFCISIPMMVVYGLALGASAGVYILWTVFTFVLPILPMILAAILGTFVAALGAGFRHKNLVQTIFTFLFVFAILYGEFALMNPSSIEDVSSIFNNINAIVIGTERFWFPICWFKDIIADLKISSILLLIASTIIVFELFFIAVSTKYRQINSRLMSHAARKNYKLTTLKTSSVTKALVNKEFQRMFKSTIYLTNNFLGEVFVVLCSIAVLVVDVDRFLAETFTGMENPAVFIRPIIPLSIYMLIGLTSTTAVSLSLEGKNLWIVKSLPIKIDTLLKSKAIFNLLLTVPFMVLGTVCFGTGLHATVPEILFFLLVGTALCFFSTNFGLFCNVLLPKFEWENEVEVVKQGASLTLYLFPNMLITMFLLIGIFLLPINSYLLLGIIAGIAAILSVIFYILSLKMAKKL